MEREILETSEAPEIIIDHIGGSLRIKGWDRQELRADADQNNTLDVKDDGEKIHLTCASGLLLRIPNLSTLHIGEVDRELMIKSIEGGIEVDTVNSQINLKNIGTTSIKNANSNLYAKQIEGDFKVTALNGNAVIRDVEGDLVIEENIGNLHFRGIANNIETNSQGNVILKLETEPGGNYEISAQGNIHCRISPDTSAKVILRSGSKAIRVKSPEIKDIFNVEEYKFELADAEGTIILDANGRIDFITYPREDAFGDEFEFEFEENIANLVDEITHQVTEQIETQIDSLTSHLNELTTGLTIGTDSADRARRKLETKRQRLERKLAQTQRKATRKVRSAAAKRREYHFRYYRGKPSDPVSDDERKMILEMLQNQQISVEETEILLAALEGREPDLPTPPEQPPESPETPPESPETPKPTEEIETEDTEGKE